MAHERDRREQPAHGTSSFPAEHFELTLPETAVPWHWHEDWEYILCTANQVRCATTQGDILLDPGYALLLGPGVVHQISPAGERCAIRSLVFHPRFLAARDSVIWEKYVAPLQSLKAVKLHPDVPWQWDCMHHFCVAWHAMDQREPGYEIQTRQALENAAFTLSRQTELLQAGGSDKARRDSRRLEQMLRFIQEHYQEELTVAQIAASASVSESECLRCFRSCLHTAPSRFLRDYRLQKAQALLLSTQETAADIAAACGFHDPAYFSKLFREATGAAPTEYRRRRPA